MILMKCSSCGRELEVDAAAQESAIACPFCGKPVLAPPPATDEPSDSETRMFEAPAKPAPAKAPEPKKPAEAFTRKKTSNDDRTLAAVVAGQTQAAYIYLAPSKADGEIGWLGHYRVLKVLGEGGMGTVFEAVDTQLQRTIALKVMKPDVAKDEFSRQRFLREARATAAVKSDFIVTIHQVGQAQQVPFLAMEFLQGEPLDRWLERTKRPTLADTLRMGVEIARGLASAHERGLIHRDIKPANIWLEAPTGRVKILDFGLARVADDKTALTHTGLIMGTPAYMAPEQAEGAQVDARCDLFSLGCILYELAAGEKPFIGPNTMALLMAVANKEPKPLRQLNAEVPPALADLIMCLLAKKPADRPASAKQVADELEGIANEMGLFVSNSSPSGTSWNKSRSARLRPPQRRRRWPFLAAGGLGILLLASLLVWLFLPRSGEIVVGISGPFSGPSKELGRQMALGIETYFQAINDQGGVHGRKLKLIALDDGYEPERALANMKELHEQRKVFAALGNIGTPTATKTVPYAVQNKMLFFGGLTGAKLLREDPPNRYVFNYRASYEEETAAIVKYLVEGRNILPQQIAVFAQQDGYGEDGFRGVAKVLHGYKRNREDILKVGYERNTADVKAAVQEISKRKDLKAVVMVATYKPAAKFIKELKDAKRDLIFTNVSFVGSEALAEELKEFGKSFVEGVIVTQVVPPIDSGSTAVAKYREMLNHFHPSETPNFTSLEGYVAATLFVEGLKRGGDNPTPEGLIDALETIRDFDLGLGAALMFGPSKHQASSKVWGTQLDEQGKYKVLELDR